MLVVLLRCKSDTRLNTPVVRCLGYAEDVWVVTQDDRCHVTRRMKRASDSPKISSYDDGRIEARES